MATIKDAVFKKKGDVPSSVLKALLVNNGGGRHHGEVGSVQVPHSEYALRDPGDHGGELYGQDHGLQAGDERPTLHGNRG